MIPFLPRRRSPPEASAAEAPPPPRPAAPGGGLCRAADVAAVAAALDGRADAARAGPWGVALSAPADARERRLAAVGALRARTEAERPPAPPSAAALPFARFACRARELEPAAHVPRPKGPVQIAVETALAPAPRPEVPGFGRWAAPWQGG